VGPNIGCASAAFTRSAGAECFGRREIRTAPAKVNTSATNSFPCVRFQGEFFEIAPAGDRLSVRVLVFAILGMRV
jgi:hypothetical protein